MILALLGIWLGMEAGAGLRNEIERHTFYREARDYCDSVGKPLLRVGMRRYFWEPPDADCTVDINPDVTKTHGGVLADEREMPFEDKQFGVCLNQHTLEHLSSPAEVEQAVGECVRVAEITVLLTPSPYSIVSNVFNPEHKVRLHYDSINNRIRVERNPRHEQTLDIGASMVLHDVSPQIYTRGGAVVIEK